MQKTDRHRDKPEDILEERRRALVLAISESERGTGGSPTLGQLRDLLVGDDRPFPILATMLAVLGDLDNHSGTGHIRFLSGNARGEFRRVALTDSGRALCDRYRTTRWKRLGAWLTSQGVTVLVAAVTAIVTTFAAESARRAFFGGP